MTDEATLRKRLAEAEDALHRLNTGGQAISIDYDGFKTTYAQTNIAQLRAYIAKLKKDLGEPAPSRRAARVTF